MSFLRPNKELLRRIESLNERISSLTKAIETLDERTCFEVRPKSDEIFFSRRTKALSGDEIMDRFEEIYETIGVQRTTIPAKEAKTKLVKKGAK